MAQALHRFDMRLRLGNIRDTSAAQRQATAEAEAKKHIPTSPTAKTAADAKAEEHAIAKAKAAAEEAAKPQKYRIRPLSESKAIESGANFISESFLFLVAGGLIVFESWRSRRKESTRREGVEDRLIELEESERTAREALVALEKELLALKAQREEQSKPLLRILPKKVWETRSEPKDTPVEESWWSSIVSYLPLGQDTSKAPSSTSQPASTPSDQTSAPKKQPEADKEPANSSESKASGSQNA